MRYTSCFRLARTNTFRLGSGKLFAKGKKQVSAYGPEYGGNAQNIEKSLRKLFIADEGTSFCQVDQAGAEALIVAYLCPPGRFRDLFLNNIKPHVYIGVFFPEHWMKEFPMVKEFSSIKIAELKNHPNWPAFAKAVAASDNSPNTSTRYYYFYKQTCHCVDDQTEVLTHDGWKLVSEVSQTEQIACWNPLDQSIKFEFPEKWHSSKFNGSMVRVTSNELDQLVTPDHKVVYYSNNKFFNCKAKDLKFSAKIPLAGYYGNNNFYLWEDEVRLLAAIQADGHIISKDSVRFRFTKERKRQRLLDLCARLNKKLSDGLASDGVYEITVSNCSGLIGVFDGNKVWGPWLLKLSKQNMEVLLDELKYWDGHLHKPEDSTTKRETYYSAIKENCDWIKTISHLVGKQATVRQDVWSQGKGYRAGLNSRKMSTIKEIKSEHYTGYVYCPTVSTGHFLIRRNGKISITGNSGNYGIMGNTFQQNLLEKSEGKVVITRAEADKFLSTYRDVAFPELHIFHRVVMNTLEQKGELRNLFGYPRKFCSLVTDPKEAYAFIPQSTVGCITNLAVVEMQRWIETTCPSAVILNNCHDSYLVQAPTETIEVVAKKMKEFIEIEMTAPRGEKFRMRSEASIGKNWAPWHEKKNPEGLKEIKL